MSWFYRSGKEVAFAGGELNTRNSTDWWALALHDRVETLFNLANELGQQGRIEEAHQAEVDALELSRELSKLTLGRF